MNSSSSVNILLAEDQLEFRDLLSKSLVKSGYGVIEASNGVEALAHFNQNSANINLVISDLMMPQMTGMELLILIRKTSDVPVIIITGNDDALKVQAFKDIELVTYLEKPFSPLTFGLTIKKALASGSAAQKVSSAGS